MSFGGKRAKLFLHTYKTLDFCSFRVGLNAPCHLVAVKHKTPNVHM